MGKKIKYILLGLSTLAVIVLFTMMQLKNRSELITDYEIKIKSDNDANLISSKEVIEFIQNEEIVFLNRSVNQLDVKNIESALDRFPFAKKSQVYVNYAGKLMIEIWEKKPVIRIYPTQGRPYYLDEVGHAFPLSGLYSADVLVASGRIDSAMSNKLYTLALHVQESTFWNAQIEQIFVSDQRTISFATKMGDQRVIFGDVDRMEAKFDKLKRFYQKAAGHVGWKKYKTINISYKDQVICK